jgi:hypothetical protein
MAAFMVLSLFRCRPWQCFTHLSSRCLFSRGMHLRYAYIATTPPRPTFNYLDAAVTDTPVVLNFPAEHTLEKRFSEGKKRKKSFSQVHLPLALAFSIYNKQQQRFIDTNKVFHLTDTNISVFSLALALLIHNKQTINNTHRHSYKGLVFNIRFLDS